MGGGQAERVNKGMGGGGCREGKGRLLPARQWGWGCGRAEPTSQLLGPRSILPAEAPRETLAGAARKFWSGSAQPPCDPARPCAPQGEPRPRLGQQLRSARRLPGLRVRGANTAFSEEALGEARAFVSQRGSRCWVLAHGLPAAPGHRRVRRARAAP